ncbi:MAG TPA: MBOAT family O-acyltransferase, partial [Puia sp.]|nr:MBOAT family O-acyltransferase [Puia sp.]
IVHTFLDPRFRNFFLLAVSLLFYSWGEGLLTLLIVCSISVNYAGGLLIEYFKKQESPWSMIILSFFITLNVLVLVYFKYFNFILSNLQLIHLFTGITLTEIHLPIGISFYTFHIISYLVDVYRRDAVSQKNPFDLGLYIFLFPQLVAGPIIRYKDISQKIASRYIIGEDFTRGLIRFIRGLAKKMLIANTVAVFADQVFAQEPANLPTAVAWFGIACYTLQIYFDFSGYSDMALGLGKMLGFNFPENFNHPYIARSIREFWQRWHISLSTWFRDYLYIPLGGNKEGKLKTYRNMFIVFFVTGLWHGASWNFIVWGMIHGCFLALERMGWSKVLEKLPRFVQHIYMLFVIVIAWVFFRADTMSYALGFLGTLAGMHHSGNFIALQHLDVYTILVFVLGLIFSTGLRARLDGWMRKNVSVYTWSLNGYVITSYFAYITLFIYCAIELAQNNYNPFIYFRF